MNSKSYQEALSLLSEGFIGVLYDLIVFLVLYLAINFIISLIPFDTVNAPTIIFPSLISALSAALLTGTFAFSIPWKFKTTKIIICLALLLVPAIYILVFSMLNPYIPGIFIWLLKY